MGLHTQCKDPFKCFLPLPPLCPSLLAPTHACTCSLLSLSQINRIFKKHKLKGCLDFSQDLFFLMSLPSVQWGEPRASLLFSSSSFPLGLSFPTSLPDEGSGAEDELTVQAFLGRGKDGSCPQSGHLCLPCALRAPQGGVCFFLIREGRAGST